MCVWLNAGAWGFFAHRLINEKAIYALPPEMFLFYKQNLSYIREHAVDPDKRRYAVKSEGQKHYLDFEFYLTSGRLNDSTYTLSWDSVKNWFGKEELQDNGTLPWNLEYMLFQLTEAFKSNDSERILRISAEIGHYAADASVPLHTTENYDGQLSGQKGIHALWESRIPERFPDSLTSIGVRSAYIENPEKEIWNIIYQSRSNVNDVLRTEMECREELRSDKIYRPSTVQKGKKPQYTSGFVDCYAKAGNLKLVKERFCASVSFVSSLWYTAWVNAGQPDLPSTQQSENKTPPTQEVEGESDHIR